MTDLPILRDLGVILAAAVIASLLARRVAAPAIVAYLAAGIVLGPVTGLVEVSESIDLLAEIGISLLLFLVGLELSLDKIRDVGRVAVVAGLGQVVFTAVGGLGISLLLGFGLVESVFISTALTFSSTVVVVKLLTQKGELDQLYGRMAVGIFLVQDLVVIVVLTLLGGLGNPEELSTVAVLRGVGGSFAGMLLLLGVALAASRYLLPRLFGWMAPAPDGLFVWSLAWCFLFFVAADRLRVSPEIGAFLAGLSLAQLPFNEELRRRVRPLMSFFVMVFFVSLSVRMEPGAAREHWVAGVVLSLFVLVGNPFIFMWIISRMGYGEKTAFSTSVTVAQISEFSFVFAAVGLSAGLIDEAVLSLIGVVGLVTIAGSVYLILYTDPIYAWLRAHGWLRLFRARPEPAAEGGHRPGGHVIVVGMNSLGRRIVHHLLTRGEEVVAVDSDPEKLLGLDCRTVAGSAEHLSVLEEAGLDGARILVSALQIEDANNLLAFRGREAGVPTSIHAFDQSVVRELREIGADHLIVSKNAGTRHLAQALRGAGVTGA